MSETFDAEAYAELMARVMGLDVRPDWKPGVVANLRNTHRMASLVLGHRLDDHVEPAFVFEA